MHAEHAAEDRQRSDVDADRRERNQHGEQHEARFRKLGQHHAQTHLHRFSRHQPRLGVVTQPQRDHHRREQRDQSLQDQQQRQALPADVQFRAGERLQHVRRKSGEVQGESQPQRPAHGARDRLLQSGGAEHLADEQQGETLQSERRE